MGSPTDRQSKPHSPRPEPQLTDEQKALREAENGLHQFDRLIEVVDEHLTDREGKAKYFYVVPSLLMELDRLAVDGLVTNPGQYRQVEMEITRSQHRPPPWEKVPAFVDDMCRYVNENWHRPAIHLAAYLLWRLNWIHPFLDGNGRTARAISYLVLCIRLRQRLPGEKTIPDLIAEGKEPYYKGLEVADKADLRGKIDVSALEEYLQRLLVEQVTNAASSGQPEAANQGRASKERTVQPAIAPAAGLPQMLRDSQAIIEALAQPERRHPSVTAAWVGGGFMLIAGVVAGLFGWLNHSNSRSSCVPRQQVPCHCPDGRESFQPCAADGTSYEECVCAAPSPPRSPPRRLSAPSPRSP